MSGYKHGVYTHEVPTSIIPPVTTTAGLTVVVGTAPINLTDPTNVNRAVMAYTYGEAIQKMGYSENFEDYTICEAISSHFALFSVAPLVFINVLDPKKHKKSETATLVVNKGEAVLKFDGVLISSLVVKSEDDLTTYEVEDYECEFDDEGFLHIFTDVAEKIKVEFDQLDPSAVTQADIIGGVSLDGSYKGLELVNEVFPRFRLVPGIIISPKFSTNSAVAAVMKAKAQNINGLFKAMAIVDVPTDVVTDYTSVPEYKNQNNLDSPDMVVCWPKVSLGGMQYHMSTQLASLINHVDGLNEGVPYKSPSNKNLQMDACVLADGSEVLLGIEQANYLNGQGILTALNWIGGWRAWGNRTSCYPGNTDPKDAFIPVRRMFLNEQNSVILTYWQKVDEPGNRKLIELIVDSKNIDLNGKAARGFILGGRVEFLEEENPLTALMDGTYTFHLFLTPPTPARELKWLFEFDPAYFKVLFD